MAIRYQERADGITSDQLFGYFQGWPNPPSPEAHLRIMQGSDYVVAALDRGTNDRVIGFVTAISDGVSCAYIPHLGVVPEWQGQGVGRELMQRMLARLSHLYMIDLMADEDVHPFYEKLGFCRGGAMIIRNYARQACD
jgi:GNAT superfamily N-acetyltransferase